MVRPTIEPTETIKTRICEALRIGASLEHAAQYAGISRRTLKRWIQKSKFEPEGGTLYLFWQQIEKANAELVISLLLRINQATAKHWKAAAWRLERLHPKHYGKPAAKSISAEEAESFEEDEDDSY